MAVWVGNMRRRGVARQVLIEKEPASLPIWTNDRVADL